MRIQGENRSGADRTGGRPAPRAAAALPPLAALQQAAGNAAVTLAIQRARDEEHAVGPEGTGAGATVPVQRRSSVAKENRKPWEPKSTPEEPVYRRAFATHPMKIGDNSADGTRGDFVEKGEIGATLRNWGDPHSHLYGLPMALGGLGNTDYHGDTILPNESYGHMFMGYKPPTHKRDGALQVGIETAGPRGKTPDGYKHGLTSSEKNSNPVSQVGGHKDDKLGGKAPSKRTSASSISRGSATGCSG
ncbi:hypothetical protein ACRAWF_03110 [Streptomyces sp. L7]